MPTVDELAQRVDDLEKTVRRLDRDVPNVRSTATLALSAAADAESVAAEAKTAADQVSDKLDAHNRVLEALRTTQLEQGTKLNDLESEVREGFGKLTHGMVEIKNLLVALTKG